MSTLIPSLTITDFRKLKAVEIKAMKSVEILSDGEVLFYAIIPPQNGGMSITDTIRTEAEYLSARGNSVGGQDPQELLGRG